MEKLVGLLHLCRKAGKLLLGQNAVLSIRGGSQRPLILLASDAGSALKRKLTGFETVTIDLSSEDMGTVFGREKLSVIGIADEHFADEVKKMLKFEKHQAV